MAGKKKKKKPLRKWWEKRQRREEEGRGNRGRRRKSNTYHICAFAASVFSTFTVHSGGKRGKGTEKNHFKKLDRHLETTFNWRKNPQCGLRTLLDVNLENGFYEKKSIIVKIHISVYYFPLLFLIENTCAASLLVGRFEIFQRQ